MMPLLPLKNRKTTAPRFKTVRTLDEKLKIIVEVEKNPSEKKIDIAKRLGLKPSTLNSIVLKKREIRNQVKKCGSFAKERKTNRQSTYRELEAVLFSWYQKIQASGYYVDGCSLREKALELAGTMGIKKFSASNGWVSRFKVRHGLAIKKHATENTAADTRVVRKEREAGIEGGLAHSEDANTSEGGSDPQPSTSQEPPHEISLREKPATCTNPASQAQIERNVARIEPEPWNTAEVFIKQEVDFADNTQTDLSSMGNSRVGEAEFALVSQGASTAPNSGREGGGQSEFGQQQRLVKKRKAALEHAYIRPQLSSTSRPTQQERSLDVESQSEHVWDSTPLQSTQQLSVGQKPKSQETPRVTQQKERILQEKEELEAVLLRLQVKKLLLEMEKISEERERIAVERSNIALRRECLQLRAQLNDSILSGDAVERPGSASMFVPSLIVKDSSSTLNKSFVSGRSGNISDCSRKSPFSGKDCVSVSPKNSNTSTVSHSPVERSSVGKSSETGVQMPRKYGSSKTQVHRSSPLTSERRTEDNALECKTGRPKTTVKAGVEDKIVGHTQGKKSAVDTVVKPVSSRKGTPSTSRMKSELPSTFSDRSSKAHTAHSPPHIPHPSSLLLSEQSASSSPSSVTSSEARGELKTSSVGASMLRDSPVQRTFQELVGTGLEFGEQETSELGQIYSESIAYLHENEPFSEDYELPAKKKKSS